MYHVQSRVYKDEREEEEPKRKMYHEVEIMFGEDTEASLQTGKGTIITKGPHLAVMPESLKK